MEVTRKVKRILIADDEAPLRLMIKTALKPLPEVEILQACDGDEALEIAIAEVPDLILLDWMMPKRTGLEIAASLRESPETSGIHIIMLTARGQTRDEEAARIAGVDHYLTKPFSPRQLVTIVQAALSIESATTATGD